MTFSSQCPSLTGEGGGGEGERVIYRVSGCPFGRKRLTTVYTLKKEKEGVCL